MVEGRIPVIIGRTMKNYFPIEIAHIISHALVKKQSSRQ